MQQYREKFAGSQADRRARDVEAANMAEQLKKTKLSGSIFVLSKCCLAYKTRDPESIIVTCGRSCLMIMY